MIARIAAQTFDDDEYFIEQRKLARYIAGYVRKLPNYEEEDVDGDEILKTIESQHGIFTERAKKVYSFSHLTFQEYFTAKFITENLSKELLRKLLKKENIIDSRWREVILNTASLLDDAEEFLSIFCEEVNKLVCEDTRICELLDWVKAKSSSVETDIKKYVIREFYCFLASEFYVLRSDFHKMIYRSVNKFESMFCNEESFDTTLELVQHELADSNPNKLDNHNVFTLKLNNNKQLPFSDNFSQNEFDLWLDVNLLTYWIFLASHSLAMTEDQSYISQSIFVEQIQRFKENFLDFIKVLKNRSDKKSYKDLVELEPNVNEWKAKDFKILANKILHFMRDNRLIKTSWNLTKTQHNLLQAYDKANELLLRCLNLAVVSNRKETENKLFIVS